MNGVKSYPAFIYTIVCGWENENGAVDKVHVYFVWVLTPSQRGRVWRNACMLLVQKLGILALPIRLQFPSHVILKSRRKVRHHKKYRITHIFHLEFIFAYFRGGLSTAKI